MNARIFRLFVVAALVLGWGIVPTAPVAAQHETLISPEPYLNADGTLNVPEGLTGSINLDGWDVTIDPQRGPLFAPITAPAEGDWEALGSNGAGDGSLNDNVHSLTVWNGDLIVGGNFTNINNNGTVLGAADYIARWDGTDWHALGSNGSGNGSLGNVVYALAVWNGDLIVGGAFTNVNNHGTALTEADYIARWDGTDWHALGSNGSGNGSFNNYVLALTMWNGDLIVGGYFSNVNNHGTALTEADYIARWDGTDWHALGSNGAGGGSLPLSSIVYALTVWNGDLVAGGLFFTVNNNGTALGAADNIARWDGTDWHALGSNGAGGGALNAIVAALTVWNGDLIVGGTFTNVNNNGTSLPEADRIARWDGTDWHALGSNGAGNGSLSSGVFALSAWDSDLIAGGSFSNVNNDGTVLNEADRIARFGLPDAAEVAVSVAEPANGCTLNASGDQCKIGDVWVNVPAGALPASAVGCRVVIEEVGAASEYGLQLDERVYDVRVVCENGSVSVFTAPLTVCIRPQDGVTSGKQLFHNHSGAGFNALSASSARVGHVCGTTAQLSLFVIGGLFLPNTGFAPGVVTQLPAPPAERAYASTELTLSIPRLNVQTAIVGVPQGPDGWDVTWLGQQAGYLYGTAFPTWAGNTVITAHVWDANNNPGPFADLADLQHGDTIEIAAFGQTYVYEVRTTASLRPTDTRTAFAPSEYDILTLITCEGFDARTGEYAARRVVTAVLVAVR